MIRKINLTPKRKIGHNFLLINACVFSVFDYVVHIHYNNMKNSYLADGDMKMTYINKNTQLISPLHKRRLLLITLTIRL